MVTLFLGVVLQACSYGKRIQCSCVVKLINSKNRLDSICENEISDTKDLFKNNKFLQLLNLVYDLTPSELITMDITEF